jgi:hypothetical protein
LVWSSGKKEGVMAYNSALLVAPKGTVRLVEYELLFDAEFLRVKDHFASVHDATEAIAELERDETLEQNAKRRERCVYGIFDDQGRARLIQEPCNWPGNRWNNGWKKPIPAMFG